MPKKAIGYFVNFAYFLSQFAVFLISALLFLSVGTADASWLLNRAEFHASAHGRTACTDCHYHVTDQPLHPNPAAVTELVRHMINNNHPLAALLFDVTGVMILSGIVLAWGRGMLQKRSRTDGTQPQDRIALALIGMIVLVGFLLEGMRILMTGRPPGTGYSFVGYWISNLSQKNQNDTR